MASRQGYVLQPEEAVIDLFLLPKRDPFTKVSEKIFFLNTLILFIILYIIKFAVASHIPRVSEALGLIILYSFSIVVLLKYITLFNTHVREWGIVGLGYHIVFLVLLILVF